MAIRNNTPPKERKMMPTISPADRLEGPGVTVMTPFWLRLLKLLFLVDTNLNVPVSDLTVWGPGWKCALAKLSLPQLRGVLSSFWELSRMSKSQSVDLARSWSLLSRK